MKTPSAFERFIARVLLAIVSFQLAFGTQIAAAQATAAAPAPADTRTTVTSSANGTPVVNIATPNSAGVSHNKFNTYDVAKGGLILNNSAANGVSLIGGGTTGNANLAGGQAASLILNEVVKANAGSMLAGYQEILGHSAELVIANPWGITCNGCGFVNTPRVTLTTGAPTLNASGALAGFTITGGQLAIGGNGLDATRQSTLDLLARAVSINGNVIVGSKTNGISGDLQVLAGSNSFDYANRTGTATPGTGASPQFAIDSSVLGGMYADRIRLLVNEHGAGVRLAGNVAAAADDLVITADGRIELRGATSSAGDLTVRGGDVQVALADSNTYLYGGRDLSINSAGGLDFGAGSIGAKRNVSFTTVGSLNDVGGANDQRFSINGVLAANVGGALDMAGGYWSAPQVSFNAASIQLGASGTVYGSGAASNSASFTTPGVLSITGGKLYSNADATLNAGRIEVDSAGVVAATGALSATVGRGSAGGIDTAGTLQGNSVSIVAAGDAPTTPTTFRNAATGQIIATKGLTIGETGASSPAGSALANEGTIAGDAVTIGTTDTSNTNAIQATTNLALNSATVENTGKDALIIGSTSATGSATLAANTITNSGQIWSAGDLVLAPTTLTQQRAAGATANPLIGAGRDLTVAYTGNADLGTGDLRAGRDLTITGAAVTDRGGVSTTTTNGDLRYAGRNLVATAAPGGSVAIGGGQWYSNGDLRLTGEDVILGHYFDQFGVQVNVAGVVLAGAQSGTGVVALDARSGSVNLNSDAAVYSGCNSATCQNPSGGDLLITQNTAFALAQPNVLQANGLLSISATGAIDNSGTIQGGTVSLASSNGAVPLNFSNRSTGSVIATQALQIGTSATPAGTVVIDPTIPNYRAGVFGGVLDINAANLFNNGILQGVGGRSNIHVGTLNNGGSIQGFADAAGLGLLAINADSITNYGTLFDEATLTVNARNLTNMASGNIASPGVLSLVAGGAGATPALNYGQIGGATLQLLFHNGLVNGLDPGVPANRGNAADIFASGSLTIQMDNGSSLINYAKIESDADLLISFIGGGSLLNQMSMLPDSELAWVWDRQPSTRTRGGAALLLTGQNNSVDKTVFVVGDPAYTSNYYYYFGDQLQSAAYQDTRDVTVWNQQFAPGLDLAAIQQPTIRAGNNLAIQNFGNLVNNGTIEAGSNVYLGGVTPATSVANNALLFGQRDKTLKFVESFTCQSARVGLTTDIGCGNTAFPPNVMLDNGAYGPFTPIIDYSAVRPGTTAFDAKIIAGGTLTIIGTVQNNGTVQDNQRPTFQLPQRQDATKKDTISVIPPGAPGSRGSAPTLSVNGATIPLPTSANGRFISAQNSTQGPLIETNPLFGIDSVALGSDYLAKLLQLNPDTQTRRIGDANYEAYLIQQQLVALTGRSVLEGYSYTDIVDGVLFQSAAETNMEGALFENAKEEAKTLSLGYGKALTSAQVASLTSDIVWMVEQEVQGQKVLVPVVYLTDATRAGQSLIGGGPTLAGYNVDINGGALKNTGGTIVAGNSLNINTAGNIENLSGRIAGWNVQLNAGGDIINSTLVKRVGDNKNGTDVAQRVASIEAGNVAILNAGNDIKINGAWVNAGKDAALIAGRNVDVKALALTTNITADDGLWSVQGQKALGAGVNAGGNAILHAGQDVNIKGAQVAAGETASVRADRGNVNIGVLELTHSASSSKTKTGTYTQLDTDKDNVTATLGAGVEHTTTTHTSTDTTGFASGISGKGIELSTGKGDVNIKGSTLDAGSDGILVDSARNVNITAYNNKSESTDTTDRVRSGVQIDASADGAFGGLAESGDKTSTTTTQTTAQTSALHSGGNIVIRGKGDVTNEGTQFDATGDVSLSGENVINKAARDTFTTSTTESKWETKQQEGLTTNGTGESIKNAVQGKGDQVSVNNLEWQQRVTGSYSTDTTTNEQSQAHGTEIKAGGNVTINAKNNASDEGTLYKAGKNVDISAESYENKAAANTNTTTNETTYGSGKVTAGLNSAAEVALTASADGGHQKSGTSTSTAKVGSINAGGQVSIKARSGDVTLEGTQLSGDKGVDITAARDVNINQANDTTKTWSSEESGSGRVSANVSLLGTGGAVGVGASTRLAESNDTTSTAKAASINSGGNVQIKAGRDLTSQGANVDAAGNVDLKATRNVNLLAATDKTDKTGSVNSGGVDVNVGFGTDAAENTGSGGANVNFEKGKTDYHESTQHGSTIKAGGKFSVDAGGNAVLQGTQVDANSADLKTGGNLTLESAQHTIKDNSYDVGGDLSASVSKGGGTGGASTVGHGGTGSSGAKGGNAAGGNGQINVMQSKQDIETNTNATIKTRGATTVDVGGDMSLKGANINADGGTSGKVAGNLTIETRTDKENVDQTNVKAYAGMGPVGGSGGGSKSQRVQEGVQTGANAVGQSGLFTDVNAQKKDNVSIGTGSGISGGKNGINLNVGGDTTLKGATNSGTDFHTAGTTTITTVDTHSSESDTKLRIAGTVASAAGSDKGKGGDFGLSVHTPGGHGGTPEEPTHSNTGATDAAAPQPRRTQPDSPMNDPNSQAPRPRAPVEAANDPNVQAPRPRGPVPAANDPNVQAPRPRAPVEAANDPNVQAPRPRAPMQAANDPSVQAPRPHAPVEAANDPNVQAPRPRAPMQAANDPNVQAPRPRAPVDAANDPNAQVPPPRVNASRPAPDERLAMVSPRNGSGPAGSDELPVHQVPDAEPPAQQHPNFAAEAAEERRNLIANDPEAHLLHIEAGALPREIGQAFDRNLAEILAFTSTPQHAAERVELRKELLGALAKSLEGPRIRTRDGVTEFPLLPNYVGENVQGFDHWKSRNLNDAPVAKYQGNVAARKIIYYTPEQQENARVYVRPDKKLVLADGEVPNGKWMFIVDQDGRMIARPFPGNDDDIHHSSLAMGKPVLMAGQFQASHGIIVDIQNQSGHYRPDTDAFKRFLVALRGQGVELNGAEAPPLKYITKADGGFNAEPDYTRNLLKDPDVENGQPIRTLLRSMKPSAEVQARIDLRPQPPAAQPGEQLLRLPRRARPAAQPAAEPGAQRANDTGAGEDKSHYNDDSANSEPANPNLGVQQPDALPVHHADPVAADGVHDGAHAPNPELMNLQHAVEPQQHEAGPQQHAVGPQQQHEGGPQQHEADLQQHEADPQQHAIVAPQLADDYGNALGNAANHPVAAQDNALLHDHPAAQELHVPPQVDNGYGADPRGAGAHPDNHAVAPDAHAQHLALANPHHENPGVDDEAPNVPVAEGPGSAQPPYNKHAWTEQTTQAVRTLLNHDGEVRAISEEASKRLLPEDLTFFQRNLAEIVTYTDQAFGASQRPHLLAELEKSLQGPQVLHGGRHDGLTEYPLLQQYVGEAIVGFDNWYMRKAESRESDIPGTKYTGGGRPADITPITYYKQDELVNKRAYVHDGKFADSHGVPLGDGKYIFVVDHDGHLIVDRPNKGKVHHSSLSAGKPVLMAGEFEIWGDSLYQITNQSGHFRPSPESFEHFLRELYDQHLVFGEARAVALSLKTDASGTFSIAEEPKFLVPEHLQRGRATMLLPLAPPLAANPSHPHGAEDQPLTWELPPQLQRLGSFWVDDSALLRRWAA